MFTKGAEKKGGLFLEKEKVVCLENVDCGSKTAQAAFLPCAGA